MTYLFFYFAVSKYCILVIFSFVSLENREWLPVIVEFSTKVQAFIFSASWLRSGLNVRKQFDLMSVGVASIFIPQGSVELDRLRALVSRFNILLKWFWSIIFQANERKTKISRVYNI